MTALREAVAILAPALGLLLGAGVLALAFNPQTPRNPGE